MNRIVVVQRTSVSLIAWSLLSLSAVSCGTESNPGFTVVPQPGAASPQVQACDATRRSLRRDAIRAFGIKAMAEQMRRISAEIPADDREQLRANAQALRSGAVSKDFDTQSKKDAADIYAEAIVKSGFTTLTAGGRVITATPSNVRIEGDEYSTVLTSARAVAVTNGTTEPLPPLEANQITEAYLTVSPDQTAYKPLLLRIKSISTGAEGQPMVASEFLTLSKYVESKLPATCAGVGTTFAAEKLDLLAARTEKTEAATAR